MSGDRPFLGLLLMVGFCVLAPLGDSMAKILGNTIPVGQIVAIRFLSQSVILVPIVWATGKSLWLPRRVFLLTLLRTGLHIVGIGSMFLALRYLPLADAIAIAFVMPFILLLLGRYALGETVGRRRLIACVVGFSGTLLVIQPSFAAVGAPALLPLVVAVVFALFMLVTRKIAKGTDPITLQATSGLVASAVLVPILWLGHDTGLPGLQVVQPSAQDWMLLAILGTLGTVAHLVMTWSLRFAPSATLAPVQYLEIPFATVIGFVLFGDLPNGLAAFGIAITIAAGLYVIWRESRSHRQVLQSPVPAPPAA